MQTEVSQTDSILTDSTPTLFFPKLAPKNNQLFYTVKKLFI